MPIYEYVCSGCGCKFEHLRPFSQANEMGSCPHCHSPARRKPSTFASFTRNAAGESAPVAGTGRSCAGCGATSCGTCGG